MPVPENLDQYLKEIQKYLELQEKLLKKAYENKPSPSDSFCELTKAIACVESLKTMQDKIFKYWDNLD